MRFKSKYLYIFGYTPIHMNNVDLMLLVMLRKYEQGQKLSMHISIMHIIMCINAHFIKNNAIKNDMNSKCSVKISTSISSIYLILLYLTKTNLKKH